MKTTTLTATGIYSVSTIAAFICTYFFNLAMTNSDQYLALVGVIMVDGFFGVIAGIKREGFQTRKAIKVLRTAIVWVMFLSVLLLVEKAFAGPAWLSETVIIPFIVFQLISALKNAHTVGVIDNSVLSQVLEKIDRHKFNHDNEKPLD
jgi:phage-related holin